MIHVLAAVIYDANRRILIAKRPDHAHQGGLWEFPGGKLEKGETRQQALVRELTEELGITATQFRPLIQIPHHYKDKSVLLDVWEVTGWSGQADGIEGQQIQWVTVDQLSQYQFPQANVPIIKACQLPPHYLITPSLKGSESDFIQQLERALARSIQLVQFRQKELSTAQLKALAARVVAVCHQAGARVLLNAEPDLVMQLNADGLQLNADTLMSLSERPLPDGYLIAASCHNAEEIHQACSLNLDFAVLSPVQATATHPDASPLGWAKFQQLVSQATLPVYALGGVQRSDTEFSWQYGAQGISAIRALWEE